jgi:hypothetical protein
MNEVKKSTQNMGQKFSNFSEKLRKEIEILRKEKSWK